MDRVFVTGASGFLGKNIIHYLQSDYEIVAYSRNPNNANGCTWIQGDILDKEKLINSMIGSSIVIHLAAITPYNEINANPFATFQNYIYGTLNVLEAIWKTKVNTLIYPSSGKVYGIPNKLPYEEAEYPCPSNLMGKIKLEVENLIKLYSEMMNNDHRAIVFRIFNAYGREQSEKFLIPKIINHLKKTEINLGRTDVKRDYIHIEDIVSAIKVAIEKSPTGYSVYNLGSGVPVSVKEIIDRICTISHRRLDVIQDISQIRNDERDIEYPDISKMLSLGWHPQISLNVGLENLLSELTY